MGTIFSTYVDRQISKYHNICGPHLSYDKLLNIYFNERELFCYNEIDILQSQNSLEEKANLITKYLMHFCYIKDNILYIKSKEHVHIPGDNKRHHYKDKIVEVKEKIYHNIFYMALFFLDFSCQIKQYDNIKVEDIHLESFLPLVIENLRHNEKSPFNDDILFKF